MRFYRFLREYILLEGTCEVTGFLRHVLMEFQVIEGQGLSKQGTSICHEVLELELLDGTRDDISWVPEHEQS